MAAKWIAVSPYSRVLSEGPLSKENAIDIQLAQIGKAATGVVRFTCKLVYFRRKLIEKSTIDFLNSMLKPEDCEETSKQSFP